jgi:hypothetical protein
VRTYDVRYGESQIRRGMPTAKVSRRRLQEGDLPLVCVKTGEPADGIVSVRFSMLPSWAFLLLLATDWAAGRGHTWGLPSRAVAAAVSSFAWVWWAAATAAVAGVATLTQRGIGWIRARPVSGTSLIELDGVNAAFATAVERQRLAS